MKHFWAFCGVISGMFAVSFNIFCQSANDAEKSQTKIANLWMKTPTREGTPDLVSPSVRSRRNALFDAGSISTERLSPENSGSFHVSEGSKFNPSGKPGMAGTPELPTVNNEVVLLGTFKGFESILTPSQKSIYTEIDISADYVFEYSGVSIAPGEHITIAIQGGTVESSSGKVISYLVDPKEYSLQPGKQYLLVMSYNPDGRFYTLAKDWDLSSGVLRPNSRLEQARADGGKSTLVGLTKGKLIPFLQSELDSRR